MNKGNEAVYRKVIRFGSVMALATAATVGIGAPAQAQSGYQITVAQDRDRDDQYRDRDDRYRDRDDYRRDRNYDQDRYRREHRRYYNYNYRGQSYNYAVDNRRGDLDPREVAERARDNGYRQGIQDGQYDASGGSRRPNPKGHGAYQFGLDGWSQDWGSGLTYQSNYRSAYTRGYMEAFGNGGRRRPY
jgi:hypothetical protein